MITLKAVLIERSDLNNPAANDIEDQLPWALFEQVMDADVVLFDGDVIKNRHGKITKQKMSVKA